MRISKYFGLNLTQPELDFVDVPTETDILLFIDPYALSIWGDVFSKVCHNLIIDFFELLLKKIREGKHAEAIRLFNGISEPNETHLGFSKGTPQGRSVGVKKIATLYNKLASSEAVLTGSLKDLQDCELVIPGISNDNISDIATNIIRGPLIDYTTAQCSLLGIETVRIPSGFYWLKGEREWQQSSVDLPLVEVDGRLEKLILVPKYIARYSLAYEYTKYYRHFVLEYLKYEHIEAGTALVRTLKDGRKRVDKQDLEKEYPLSKEFLYEFSEKHPEVLSKYKASVIPELVCISDEQLEDKRPDREELDYAALINDLDSITPGSDGAYEYHKKIVGILEALFYPNLRNPVKENEILEGRKRIDVTFDNTDRVGFFADLADRHGIRCPYIIAEAKNYQEDPSNPELDQLSGRLDPKRGMFGILVCRSIKDKPLFIKRCRGYLRKDEYIIYLDDEDIKSALRFKALGNEEAINDLLRGRLRDIID